MSRRVKTTYDQERHLRQERTVEKSAVLFFYFQHAHDCFIHYSITKEFF